MSKKKSYMDRKNILNEGFFEKFAKFFKSIPKAIESVKREKLKWKIAPNLNKLNKHIEELDRLLKKDVGKDYPDVPKFTMDDFLNRK